MMPDVHTLYDVIEATWPPAARHDTGPITLRNGAGGGKRVSAATARLPVTAEELTRAEAEMTDMGQDPLFMIRDGDAGVDIMLEWQGYDIIDPVNLYAGDVIDPKTIKLKNTTTFCVWEPLAIMRDIWAAGGIGPDRVAVMERATCPKTTIFGRDRNRPAAAAYVGIHKNIAMLHALEVLEGHRGVGLGTQMMYRAATWAFENGAKEMAVVCTQANEGANNLYASLGFLSVGTYHYRIKKAET